MPRAKMVSKRFQFERWRQGFAPHIEVITLCVAGKLTLVQVSTMSGQVNIFDVQTSPALMVIGGLKKLLESNIVKV